MGHDGSEGAEDQQCCAKNQHAIELALWHPAGQLRQLQQAQGGKQQRRAQQQAHVALQRAVLQALRQRLAACHQTLDAVLEDHPCIGGGELTHETADRGMHAVERDTASQCDQTHDQGRIDAVPDGQVELEVPAQYGLGRKIQQASGQYRREQAYRHADHDEKLYRYPH